jgi:hypothetical protein
MSGLTKITLLQRKEWSERPAGLASVGVRKMKLAALVDVRTGNSPCTR